MKIYHCQYCTGPVKQLRHDNIYCPKCKAHHYKGDWYTRQEWEAWIEGEGDGDTDRPIRLSK